MQKKFILPPAKLPSVMISVFSVASSAGFPFILKVINSFDASDVYDSLKIVLNPDGKNNEEKKAIFPPGRLPFVIISVSSKAPSEGFPFILE